MSIRKNLLAILLLCCLFACQKENLSTNLNEEQLFSKEIKLATTGKHKGLTVSISSNNKELLEQYNESNLKIEPLLKIPKIEHNESAFSQFDNTDIPSNNDFILIETPASFPSEFVGIKVKDLSFMDKLNQKGLPNTKDARCEKSGNWNTWTPIFISHDKEGVITSNHCNQSVKCRYFLDEFRDNNGDNCLEEEHSDCFGFRSLCESRCNQASYRLSLIHI